MQRPTPYHTRPSPVASRTRQDTTAAAARAARHAGQPILVSGACKLALQSRGGNLAQPAIQPTAEEIRAAIPEHGIQIHELFQLFIARLPSIESLDAFVADFQSVASQDPVDQLIFPRDNTSSAEQGPSSFSSRLSPDASVRDRCLALVSDLHQATFASVDARLVPVAWDIEAIKARRNAQQ